MAETLEVLQQALVGRYRVERELGRGGVATVFLAEDLKHHRQVAIKVLEPELASAIGPERFLREIETSARLAHPHILPLHDSGVAGELLYYVMPYVEGESLQARLAREKQLPLEDALRIAREVGDALAFAHRHGVVHRDIKPGNILLESGHAVVADFGLARPISSTGVDPQAPTGAGTLTGAGIALGTPAYMSPEQASGVTHVDGRSDVYALGCVVYEMLAGQPPFTGPTVESLMHQHLSVAPRPVTDLRPAVPAVVRDALAKSLAKVPADRFATTAEFAAALEAKSARVPALRAPVRAMVAAVAVVAVALAILAWWQARARHPAQPRPVKSEWIMLAEFDGPADDPALAGTVRALMSADLERSGLLRAVPADQVKVALALAEKPDSTRVTEAVARELALRNNIGSVLSGQVLRAGKSYSVVVRVVNAASADLVATLREQARDADELIPAVGKLTRGLLENVGSRIPALRRPLDVYEGETRSFEAFRLYHRSVELTANGRYEEGVAVLRQALRLDPDYGVAWGWLSIVYFNLGMADSSFYASEQAMKRLDRIAEPGRSNFQADYLNTLGDPQGALRIYDRLVEQYPGVADLHSLRAWTLANLDHQEAALAEFRTAASLYPIKPPPLGRMLVVRTLIVLGRLDEAWAHIDSLNSTYAAACGIWASLAAEQWSRAESVAVAARRLPAPDMLIDFYSSQLLATLPASRGDLRGGARALARQESLWSGKGFDLDLHLVRRLQVILPAIAVGLGGPPASAMPVDSSISSLVSLGMSHAGSGDAGGAARILQAIHRRPRQELRRFGTAPALLEAWLERDAGRWPQVVEKLGPLCEWDGHCGWGMDSPGRPLARWLVAEAFDRMARPDSAAVYYEAATSSLGLLMPEQIQGMVLKPLAHQRLAVLYAGMGRTADAERHLATLETFWSRPEDVARRLLDEARAAVDAAKGAAAGTRRIGVMIEPFEFDRVHGAGDRPARPGGGFADVR